MLNYCKNLLLFFHYTKVYVFCKRERFSWQLEAKHLRLCQLTQLLSQSFRDKTVSEKKCCMVQILDHFILAEVCCLTVINLPMFRYIHIAYFTLIDSLYVFINWWAPIFCILIHKTNMSFNSSENCPIVYDSVYMYCKFSLVLTINVSLQCFEYTCIKENVHVMLIALLSHKSFAITCCLNWWKNRI